MVEEGQETLELSDHSPQYVNIVTEKNKSGTWCLAAYLTRMDGVRDRRTVGTCETYEDACHLLRAIWTELGQN